MNRQHFDQEETKIQSLDQPKPETREVIRARSFKGFAALTKKKLHIHSQRKVDKQVSLGSRGFEEEKRSSKTDDDLVLSSRRNKVLHLTKRNAIDLTKKKVSLIKKDASSKQEDGMDTVVKDDVATKKKRKFGEVIAD